MARRPTPSVPASVHPAAAGLRRLFSAVPSAARTPRVERIVAELTQGSVAVDIRRSPRARRMTLRVPPGSASPVVTVPARVAIGAVERFVASQTGWLAARLAERLPHVAFAEGVVIPLRGEPHVVRRTGRVRGSVERLPGDPATLFVPGAAEHLERRLSDWLKAEARRDLTAAVAGFAAKVNRRPTAIRIRDTRAQWGSCSPSGVLSFSFRLVLAPPFVLDYVAAHEVAHLVELNHSDAFWEVNARLDPDLERARAWLKRHGRSLHAIGGTG